MPRKIYLSSTSYNPHFDDVVAALRGEGHSVFDFRKPEGMPEGTVSRYAFEMIDPLWKGWRTDQFIIGLECAPAKEQFDFVKAAIDEADTVVLLAPCGLSSHIIAGYAAGAGKDVFALLLNPEDFMPELMYKLFNGSVEHLDQLLAILAEEREPVPSLPLPLMFDEVTKLNIERCDLWHKNGIADWSPERWASAFMGELGEASGAVSALAALFLTNEMVKRGGEACNALKKLFRIEDKIANISEPDRQLNEVEAAVSKIGEELADTYLYLNLLAARLGLNLPAEVIKKFNSVSIKYGFPQRLRSE
jgi:hypothetical protein